MFGRKKNTKSNGIAEDLSMFLDEADARYIKAFETRSVRVLKEYFTKDCCIMMSRWIVAEASSRYFSEERFRNTYWEITEQSPTQIVVHKKCIYDDIHLTISRVMKVSEDYEELWYISVTPDEYWVTDIKPVRGYL